MPSIHGLWEVACPLAAFGGSMRPWHHTTFCGAIQCLLGVLNYHSWTDATASRQLATTLMNADDNSLTKQLIRDSTGVLLPARTIGS